MLEIKRGDLTAFIGESHAEVWSGMGSSRQFLVARYNGRRSEIQALSLLEREG